MLSRLSPFVHREISILTNVKSRVSCQKALSAMRKHGRYGPFGRIPSKWVLNNGSCHDANFIVTNDDRVVFVTTTESCHDANFLSPMVPRPMSPLWQPPMALVTTALIMKTFVFPTFYVNISFNCDHAFNCVVYFNCFHSLSVFIVVHFCRIINIISLMVWLNTISIPQLVQTWLLLTQSIPYKGMDK